MPKRSREQTQTEDFTPRNRFNYDEIYRLSNRSKPDSVGIKNILKQVVREELLSFIEKHQYDRRDDFHAYMSMGRCLEEMGRHQEALMLFHQMDQNNFTVKLTIGRCLEEMGQHQEALALFRGMDSNNPTVKLAIGRCLEEMGRHQEALDLYHQMDPNNFTVKLAIGRCLEKLGQYQESLALFRGMDQNNPTVKLAIGRCLQEIGRHQEALALFRGMDSNNPTVKLAIGRCLEEMGRHQEALTLYHQMDPNNFTVKLTIGRCLEEIGRHQEALALFRGMDSNNPTVKLAIGRCLEEMGRHQEALDLYHQMDPNNFTVKLAIGRCLEGMEEIDNANQIYDELLKTYSSNQTIILTKGIFLEKNKSKLMAKAFFYDQVKRHSIAHAKSYISYIRLARQDGAYKKIKSVYERAKQKQILTPDLVYAFIQAAGINKDLKAIKRAYKDELEGISIRNKCVDESAAEALCSEKIKCIYAQYVHCLERLSAPPTANDATSGPSVSDVPPILSVNNPYLSVLSSTYSTVDTTEDNSVASIRVNNSYLSVVASSQSTVDTTEDKTIFTVRKSHTPLPHLSRALISYITASKHTHEIQFESVKEAFNAALKNHPACALRQEVIYAYLITAKDFSQYEEVQRAYFIAGQNGLMDEDIHSEAMMAAYLSFNLNLACNVMDMAVQSNQLNVEIVSQFITLAQYFSRQDLIQQAYADARRLLSAEGCAILTPPSFEGRNASLRFYQRNDTALRAQEVPLPSPR